MKTTSIEEYFNSISYDYQNDQDNLKDILRLTKTRVDNTKENFEFVYGMEQTFFIKSLAENISAENFFEIGTGRGTSCYALSLLDKVKNITTVDIVPHTQKKYEAINFKPAIVSNLDLYELIQLPQKEKINFKHVSDYENIVEDFSNSFDLCFIDGNHSDYDIIKSDFDTCLKVIKNEGILIWDDYVPGKFTVTEVVDDIINEYKFDSTLYECAGHIFNDGTREPEKGRGIVTMKITK